MPDFSQLLRKPAGEAKKPPLLPSDDYPGVVKGHELGDANKNKTPYVRFSLGFTGWGENVPDSWDEVDEAGKVYQVTKADVDLSKRQQRRDFFFTDDALWRLDEFIRSCGIEAQGRSYEEILPELTGCPVLIEVQQQLNQTNNNMFNQVGKVVGTAGS
jgi:hypothetical protein